MNRVAITGAGIISSLGLDLASYGTKLIDGYLAVEEVPWEVKDGGAWISPVTGFDPHKWMGDRVVAGTDPFAQYAIAAATEALKSAEITEPPPLRTAVVLGTSMAGATTFAEAQHALDTQGPEAVSSKVHIRSWANMAAGQVALKWGLHGPLLSISTACASSLDAIGIATRMIATGMADIAIAGGSENAVTEVLHHSELAYGMSVPTEDPTQVSRPFDIHRKGLLKGEGAGVVILESVAHAQARGARQWAEVRGYASLSDAFHPSSPDPTGQWEALCMRNAIADAQLADGANEIDAVIAHGTGTKLGDSAEIRALNSVFGDRRDPPPVTSIKGHLGHTGGAAGVMALIGGLHGMRTGAFMPTVGCHDVDPEANFPIVTHQAKEMEIRTLQVNSFGFGGQDASLIVSAA